MGQDRERPGETNVKPVGFFRRRCVDPLFHFFAREIWPINRPHVTGWRRFGYRLARVVGLTVHGFWKDQSFYRAAALSFITVLSFVPLLAFLFATAKEFGGYDSLVTHTIIPFLDNTFGPATQVSATQDVRQAIDKILAYISSTNVLSLGMFGLLFLLYTGLQLLHSVEESFNEIWHVQTDRPIARKLANYISVIAIAPIAMLIATGITAAAQNSAAVIWLKETLYLGPFFKFIPLAMMCGGLMVIYLLMPNTRIRFSSALLGAAVAGSMWQVAQVLHLTSQITIARYNAIYAGFAALPIFLVWIFISWVTILIGAELACAHQTEPGYSRPPWLLPDDHAFKERLTLRAMVLFGSRFLEGRTPITTGRLSAELGVYEGAVRTLLRPLIDHGLIAITGNKSEAQVLLTRTLDTIRVKDVLDIIKRPRRSMGRVPWNTDDIVQETLLAMDRDLKTSEHNCTLRELIENPPAAGGVSPPLGQPPEESKPEQSESPESADEAETRLVDTGKPDQLH